jgi:hypothetical protein
LIETLEIRALIILAGCGVLMAALAFAPWMTFRSSFEPHGPGAISFDVAGTRLSALRDDEVVGRDDVESTYGWCSCHVDPGDGYVVAAFGAVIALAASAGLVTGRASLVPPVALLLGLAAVVVVAYNAFAEEWNALAYTRSAQLQAVTGDATPWLYTLIPISATASILGALLWGIVRAGYEDDEDEDEAVWA